MMEDQGMKWIKTLGKAAIFFVVVFFLAFLALNILPGLFLMM